MGDSILKLWTAAPKEELQAVSEQALLSLPDAASIQAVRFDDTPLYPGPGEVVLAFGVKPLSCLQRAGLVPKNRTVTSMRGLPVKGPPHRDDAGGLCCGYWFFTFDPQTRHSDAAKPAEIAWDIALAARFHRTGSLEPSLGNYAWVDDFSRAIGQIEATYARNYASEIAAGKSPEKAAVAAAVPVGCDTETLGLVPYIQEAWIISISFSVAPGMADMLHFPKQGDKPTRKQRAQIEWLLNTPKVKIVGANFKYDAIWIEQKWGIRCTNFPFDTVIVGSLLDENRSNSLSTHAKIMTPLGGYDDSFNREFDKSRMDLVPADRLGRYQGGDTDAVLRTYHVLRKQLMDDKALTRFYAKLLHPAARAFERVEQRGVLVDYEKFRALEGDLVAASQQLQTEMLELMPGRVRAKHSAEIADKLAEGKTPFTAKIVSDMFFSDLGYGFKPKMQTAKSRKPSTSFDHLMMFADYPDAATFVQKLEAYNSASKTLSTYVRGFLQHLRPDGRFHPTYALFRGTLYIEDDDAGARTGRTSARDPAMQTLPLYTIWADRLRECFPAPEDWFFFQVDFEQGELRIAACLAHEPTMLQAYKDNKDLHAITAAYIVKTPLDKFLELKKADPKKFSALRQIGKSANFGLLYGMGAAGFVAYCWNSSQTKITEEDAEAYRADFMRLYAGLPDWHERARQTARRHGFIRSPLGRVRHLPLIKSYDQEVRAYAERQAINAPVQATLSDLALWAIARVEELLVPHYPIQIVGMTHDSLYGYVPAARAQELTYKIIEVMNELPYRQVFQWEPELTFPADGEIGPNLAKLTKLKELKPAA